MTTDTVQIEINTWNNGLVTIECEERSNLMDAIRIYDDENGTDHFYNLQESDIWSVNGHQY